MKLLNGNNLELLKTLDADSVDSIVTDPPYGLSFMSKKWDYDVPSVDFWREAFRVLKPGGHVLSFGGTRTYHRLVVAIEDAGFEIRDQIQWLYGSGFPKSQDVSKQIDKQAGAKRERGPIDPARAGRLVNQSGDYETDSGWSAGNRSITIDPPATEAAKLWQGWGTALKPANEPICVARKPLEKGLTVAANVLKWGTGAINIDASRVEGIAETPFGKQVGTDSKNGNGKTHGKMERTEFTPHTQGRWPANIILDEEAAKALDEQSGILKSGSLAPGHKRGDGTGNSLMGGGGTITKQYGNDSGGASRFFYVAKASKRERNAGLETQANIHPTVKPIKLMEYLIKLVTPKDGTVLDPFMGSGTTGVAAARLNVNFVGMELDESYFQIAKARIEHASTAPQSEQDINDDLDSAALEDSSGA